MKALAEWLKRRRRRYHSPYPELHWKPYLAIAAALVLLTALVFDAPLGAGPERISPVARALGNQITDFGKSDWILLSSAFLFVTGLASARLLRVARARTHAWFITHVGAYVFIAIAGSGLAANLLKRVIGRARPVNFQDLGIYDFSPFSGSRFESFPSGHATTVGALFMALALLLPRYRLLFVLLAVWFAMSRVMVGAHYPSDVMAGLVFGAWFSLMMAIVFSRHGLVFRIDVDGMPTPRQSLVYRGPPIGNGPMPGPKV